MKNVKLTKWYIALTYDFLFFFVCSSLFFESSKEYFI